ncbi:MAG: hypothetical protein AAGC54_17600 [Cyanobacteria bacterium P01_F01_bin.4]
MHVPDPFLASILKDRYQLQQQLSKKAGRRTLFAFDRQTQQPVVLKILTFSQELTWEEISWYLYAPHQCPYDPPMVSIFTTRSGQAQYPLSENLTHIFVESAILPWLYRNSL